ncbi:MAG: hypothetical protein WBD86_01870 [Microgenomates group bacterium]
MSKTQIEVTDLVKQISASLGGDGLEFLQNAMDYVNHKIKRKKYDKDVVEEERKVRWKRTAHQILKDDYVYGQKGCTDLVITFQALCEAKGYKTNFVKVKGKEGKQIHSIAEVKLGKDWFKVDVAGKAGVKKEKLQKSEVFGIWHFWMRGRDAWDLGFTSFDSI